MSQDYLKKVDPTLKRVWNTLETHYYEISGQLNEFFTPERFDEFSLSFNDLFIDYSKTHVNKTTMKLLIKLAEECNLQEAIEMMFEGVKINETENRAVLHTALRNFSNTSVEVDGDDIMPEIRSVLQKIKSFTQELHNGQRCGFSGKKIDTIVNIGIGGSDLGPKMACNALTHYAIEGMKCYFVSNVDGTHIYETLKECNPETTLFLIVSKTFTTQETMTNANSAKNWFLQYASENEIGKHFVAVSTNEKAVENFGIDKKNMFVFWDFVGGRYSMWSSVGLSIACYIGYNNFEQMLKGGEKMDIHFRTTPLDKNIPVIMALLGIWYISFHNYHSETILPYDQYLDRFPAYLQQLIMESNGKYVDRNGEIINYLTSPIIWGEPGTNGQHSFYQLLHQGTVNNLSIFIAGAQPLNSLENHHKILLSNFFAQTEALMNGKDEEQVVAELKAKGLSKDDIKKLAPHKVFEGDKPSISILYKKLTPEILGMLVSMFEHRTFVQGIIWNIYSFDQFGVELGKELANNILPELENDDEIDSHDSSTNGLINKYKEFRKS